MDVVKDTWNWVTAEKWRAAVVLVVIVLVIWAFYSAASAETFIQGPDPTEVVTLYYRPNCPQCTPVFYHWDILTRNLTTDGRIKTRAVDCTDPNFANECARWKGNFPVITRQQASGRIHIFQGNHVHQNLYDFANRDY